jgi:hypothetical protein
MEGVVDNNIVHEKFSGQTVAEIIVERVLQVVAVMLIVETQSRPPSFPTELPGNE